MLADRARAVAEHYAPGGVVVKDNYLARAHWRGDQAIGSFMVGIAGPRQGIAVDFAESNQGFNLLELIRRAIGADGIGAAAVEARKFLGLVDLTPEDREARRRRALEAEKRRAAEAQRRAAALDEHRRKSQALWLAARPLELDCPVGLYLAGRGIDLSVLEPLPGGMRFHPEVWCAERREKRPAMVSAVVAPDGRWLAVHRTWIEPGADGFWHKAPIVHPKKTWPAFEGGFVPVWRGAHKGSMASLDTERHGPLWTPEGIEDGLSHATALPERRIVAAISVTNLANLDLPAAIRSIVVPVDNDGDNAASAAAIDRAFTRWRAEGRTVCTWRAAIGKDANDMLRGAA